MGRGALGFLIALTAAAGLSCSRPAGPLDVALVTDPRTHEAFVEVLGLSPSETRGIRAAALSLDRWAALLHVSVAGQTGESIVGQYLVTETTVEFHPRYPFDRGREYAVRFDPSKLPTPRPAPAVERVVSLPAPPQAPATRVTAIYPSGDVWPENVLRFYVHFSAPMSRSSGMRYVHLMDESGEEVPDSLLTVDANFWNSDFTRFTVFFDPGRVKRSVRSNAEMGRALQSGRRYSIAIDPRWPDAAGRPLFDGYRHDFLAGPPEERAIDVDAWTITAPKAGTTAPLVVAFGRPLDEGLLQRALGVAAGVGRGEAALAGALVDGQVSTADRESRWSFTPKTPWEAGPYQLVVLTLLEDPAGNKVGRAFEVLSGTSAAPLPDTVTLPFAIAR